MDALKLAVEQAALSPVGEHPCGPLIRQVRTRFNSELDNICGALPPSPTLRDLAEVLGRTPEDVLYTSPAIICMLGERGLIYPEQTPGRNLPAKLQDLAKEKKASLLTCGRLGI